MMMALRPEWVATNRIHLAKANPSPNPEPGVYRWRTIAARSGSGVIGHPEAASAAKGEKLLEAISDTLAAKLSNSDLWSLPWKA